MYRSFSELQPDMVLDAVEAFGVEVSGHCYPLNSYENRVFQVGVEDGPPVIAKFYRPGRWTIEQIKEEHGFAAKLSTAGVKTAKNLVSAAGDTIVEFDGFYCSVQQKIMGRMPEVDNFDNLYQLGQIIGEMHAATGSYQLTVRNVFDPQAMGSDNADFLAASWLPKKQLALYRKCVNALLQRIDQCLPADFSDSFLSIHGDCHLSNVLMTNSGPVLLDFDDVMSGPAMQDLWMFLAGDKIQQKKQLSELIEGYQESLDFPEQQLGWVPALRALRVINYTAWLAKRWSDPAFPLAFPWFNSEDFWIAHIKELQQLTKDFDAGLDATPARGGNF
ncbi:MAG: serine/threonine protein kinase [Oceanospirillaceae bacterium]|nr:serine/threonine protein kinase [Oceanospirillaceae bacterium]